MGKKKYKSKIPKLVDCDLLPSRIGVPVQALARHLQPGAALGDQMNAAEVACAQHAHMPETGLDGRLAESQPSSPGHELLELVALPMRDRRRRRRRRRVDGSIEPRQVEASALTAC